MRKNHSLRLRASLLFNLMLAVALASTQMRADTGTCGGQSITLPFTDVPASNIFFCSIAAAYFTGLTNGTSATTYSPAASVPREQMAAFITRTQDSALRRGSRRAVLDQWWTPQDHNGLRVTTVGNSPQLLKSDGADIWVANLLSATVMRVRASDGKLLETWTGATLARGIVVAAGRIFISGSTTPGTLYSIDPTAPPGAVATVASTLGDVPLGIAFDGLHVWTANVGTGPGLGSISRVHIGTNSVATFTTGFSRPAGILYDGVNLWITDEGDDTLKRVDPATGAVLQTVNVGLNPEFLVFDGTNIWVPNSGSNSVSVVRAGGGLQGAVLAVLTGNGLDLPITAAFDGERLLVTNAGGDSVSVWKAADFTPLGSVFTGVGTVPVGTCSDGLNFWISLQDSDSLARF